MTVYETIGQVREALSGILKIDGDRVEVIDEGKLRSRLIDELIFSAVFSADSDVCAACRWLIRQTGAAVGAYVASIQSLYEAMGRKEVGGFTVPAINIRTLTYETAQAVLRAAFKGRVGPVIFEIARSEIGYTLQRPAEYTSAIVAAAIKTGYRGPLFIQGDHFQLNAKKFAEDAEKETQAVKDLIWEALDAGFYNIDIDSSTLVDLSRPTIKEQQDLNYTLAAELTAMIRDLEPEGITVSVGGEIGEVGGKNSTVEELRAFMDGYHEELKKNGEELKGISKISVQTGTTHGGVPLPDGTVAKVKIDFDTLEKLSETARAEYGLAGAVQHGASTLPDEAFDQFPARGTAEVHLATGFQNIVCESEAFPPELREKIYRFIREEHADEKKDSDTEEQFLYKTRKKGLGPFKRELWTLPEERMRTIMGELENQFAFLFAKLGVNDTDSVLTKYVSPVNVSLPCPEQLK
ncbi:MAG: class II fructose-bisphosphate aldolase [Syntrophales bacterium]|nr:class II fructose-bisphosphate aldolase [Syntrophales bacterium]